MEPCPGSVLDSLVTLVNSSDVARGCVLDSTSTQYWGVGTGPASLSGARSSSSRQWRRALRPPPGGITSPRGI
eukprot:7353953-Pyramimonas_sp.AAC.1